jgi:hypothetical protein
MNDTIRALINVARKHDAFRARLRQSKSHPAGLLRLILVFADAASCTNFYLSDWCDPFNPDTPVTALRSRGRVMVLLVDVR